MGARRGGRIGMEIGSGDRAEDYSGRYKDSVLEKSEALAQRWNGRKAEPAAFIFESHSLRSMAWPFAFESKGRLDGIHASRGGAAVC